jgi:hypothetical protein
MVRVTTKQGESNFAFINLFTVLLVINFGFIVFYHAGYWSRRISDEHRLVYKVDDAKIIIYRCHGHYS